MITIGHHQLPFSDQQVPETEQDEFEKTMVIPTGQQNADQLARAEAAAEKAAAVAANEPARAAADEPATETAASDDIAAAVKLDPEEAAGLDRTPPPAAPQQDMAETVASATATGIGIENAPNALPLAKLQVLSGAFAGRELELTKALTTLGRPGVQVAAITRRAEGYYIVHVESGQEGDYPLVNGKPIGPQAKKLSDNDVVQLAGVKMGFFAA